MKCIEIVVHPVHPRVNVHQSLFARLAITKRERIGDALGVLFELAQAPLDGSDTSVGDPDAWHYSDDVCAGALN